MLTARSRPLNSSEVGAERSSQGLQADPRVAPAPPALPSPQAPLAARPLTFARALGTRRGQQLRQRQEQDEQAGFPGPHRGSGH